MRVGSCHAQTPSHGPSFPGESIGLLPGQRLSQVHLNLFFFSRKNDHCTLLHTYPMKYFTNNCYEIVLILNYKLIFVLVNLVTDISYKELKLKTPAIKFRIQGVLEIFKKIIALFYSFILQFPSTKFS